MQQHLTYFDYAATTPVRPEAAAALADALGQFGNPSSRYEFGREAARRVKEHRDAVAEAFGCSPSELFFTSCGTEGDNWAIRAALHQNRRVGKHIVTTAVEHSAVLQCVKQLEREGYTASYVKPDGEGHISAEAVLNAVREDTALVSVMLVNNETGARLPVEEIAALLRDRPALLHTDAVQGFLKVPFTAAGLGADYAVISAHKVGGPKGAGALYIGGRAKNTLPLLFGGGQQNGLRSGTENVPGIAGISLAAKMIYQDLDVKVARMRRLKQRFIKGVSQIEDTVIHGLYDETSAPHIISVGFAGIRSEVLLHALEEKGIYVSSGSACSSNHPQVSGVLKGIGARQEFLDATLRFSMSEFTTPQEIDYTLDTLYNIVPNLRKYTRR